MPVSEAKKRANNKYTKKTYSRFTVNLRNDTDSEIIDYITAEDTATTAVRKLFSENKKLKEL